MSKHLFVQLLRDLPGKVDSVIDDLLRLQWLEVWFGAEGR